MKQFKAKRIGDFYEFYGEEAKAVCDAIGIFLTSRTIDGVQVPMCGIPFHSEWRYEEALKEHGIEPVWPR